MANYTIKKEIDEPMDQVIQNLEEQLGDEGFGVLTEIDLKEAVINNNQEELKQKFKEAVASKPAAHSLTDKNECLTKMSQIGG